MPWPEPVVSARSIVLDLPPSCIEFCPAHPSYFLVGTYNLIKDIPDTESRASQDKKDNDPEDSDTVSKKTQNRNGTILVFQLQDDEIKHVQTVDQPSALLDLHFQTVEGRNDICGVVSSTGYLSTFQLSPIASSPQPLQQVSTVRIPDVGEEVLFLSLAWHPTDPDLVAITTSTNDVYLLRLNPAHTTFVAGLQPIISHDLEAWTVSLSSPLLRINPETPANQADWFTLYSGGDDSTLRFTSCQVEKQNDGDAAAATPYAPVKVPGHTAGVTAILPVDVMFRDGSSLVITGSYDDHLRAYAIQPLHETYGMRKSKLLTEINLGGGVWRLKLIGTRSDTDGRWTARILASCMHAGARVVELSGGSEPACGIEVLARFEEHKSMNYGSDFHVDEASPGQLSCVSTSFYDRLLCLWHLDLDQQ